MDYKSLSTVVYQLHIHNHVTVLTPQKLYMHPMEGGDGHYLDIVHQHLQSVSSQQCWGHRYSLSGQPLTQCSAHHPDRLDHFPHQRMHQSRLWHLGEVSTGKVSIDHTVEYFHKLHDDVFCICSVDYIYKCICVHSKTAIK